MQHWTSLCQRRVIVPEWLKNCWKVASEHSSAGFCYCSIAFPAMWIKERDLSKPPQTQTQVKWPPENGKMVVFILERSNAAKMAQTVAGPRDARCSPCVHDLCNFWKCHDVTASEARDRWRMHFFSAESKASDMISSIPLNAWQGFPGSHHLHSRYELKFNKSTEW